MFAGSGAALLWAGGTALLRGTTPAATAARPVGDLPAALSVGELPFADDFGNAALPAWNVRRPVAILGTTPFGFAFPANQALDRPEVLQGRGTVIGLDGPLAGSTGPGLLETVDRFAFEAGATYALRFSLAGSQRRSDRMPPSTATASLPGLGVARQVTRRPHDDFVDFELEATVPRSASSTIVFASGTTPGQAGLLLGSVSLTRTG